MEAESGRIQSNSIFDKFNAENKNKRSKSGRMSTGD
jgi:hypothetical protein